MLQESYLTHPNQVHFFAVLHKIPDFWSHLLPHAPEISEHTKLLKCFVDLREKQIKLKGSSRTMVDNLHHLYDLLTSCMILWVAGVSGVYKIFPMSSGFKALQIIREMGLDSKPFIKLLQ